MTMCYEIVPVMNRRPMGVEVVPGMECISVSSLSAARSPSGVMFRGGAVVTKAGLSTDAPVS